ncbi:uncharacterized protein LOC110030157 [Phalaenopsis equestris]|uniref:uncharacterized protein LOC110030157 n=1 Tax=Phalaenopsis equestris TaxID=78828 RepID=UPI0009E2758A|nr:uncharacterized protein LOC110030157 [Phalaenopsis equestris]
MRSRKTTTRKRNVAASPELDRPSIDSPGVELNRSSVHPGTSIRPVASLLNHHAGYVAEDEQRWLSDEPVEDLSNKTGRIVGLGGVTNPRSFPYSVKQQCWEKAEKVKGRDPERWRRDPFGNIMFRKLVGCPGCLCHDYDHIVPYSKGGKSTLENCQVVQATVNRSKGNKTELSKSDLIQKSAYCRVSGRDLDLIEHSAYGNIRRAQEPGGCNIQ